MEYFCKLFNGVSREILNRGELHNLQECRNSYWQIREWEVSRTSIKIKNREVVDPWLPIEVWKVKGEISISWIVNLKKMHKWRKNTFISIYKNNGHPGLGQLWMD